MSLDKLSLFPLNTTINQTGLLTVDGHSAVGLAQQFGTPLYLFHVDTIRRQIETYRQGLASYRGLARLTYASKAFQCLALVQILSREGVGLDVASAGEIYIAQQGGADPAMMHLHGNNKTEQDLRSALQVGLGHIVVDNRAELARLLSLLPEAQSPVKLWLRITPGIAIDTPHRYTVTGQADSKFGVSPVEAESIAAEILTLDHTASLRLTGLHLHLGSHFHQAAPVVEAINTLLDLAKKLQQRYGWQMETLCAGGGWGVRYHPADPPMPIKPFLADLIAGLEAGCADRDLPLPELVLEPGRSLIAQAGVALYTVGGRKSLPQLRTYVSIDGGLADNPRPALYQARYTALLGNRASAPDEETVAIAGPYCESGDILIEAVKLPQAKPGDILAVPVAGAYQLAMSSNYNAALRPAVVFIEGKAVTLVQRRETLADLVQRDALLP